jgi:hypothetical protein
LFFNVQSCSPILSHVKGGAGGENRGNSSSKLHAKLGDLTKHADNCAATAATSKASGAVSGGGGGGGGSKKGREETSGKNAKEKSITSFFQKKL